MIDILVVAPQEYVTIYSTRRASSASRTLSSAADAVLTASAYKKRGGGEVSKDTHTHTQIYMYIYVYINRVNPT